MTSQTQLTRLFNTVGTLLLIILAVFGLPQLWQAIAAPTNIFVLLGLVLLHAFSVRMTHNKSIGWRAIVRLPIVVVWVLFGMQLAAMIAIVGTLINVIMLSLSSTDDVPIATRYLPVLADTAVSLIGIELVYALLGGSMPHFDDVGMYASTGALLLSLIVGSLLSIGLQATLGSIKTDSILRDADTFTFTELLVVIAGLILPLVLVQLDVVLFLVGLGAIALLVYRQTHMTHTIDKLAARINEMATMSNLSSTIVSQLSLVGTLDSICQELERALNPTMIAIALYDEDHDSLNYQVVRVHGKDIPAADDILNTQLTDYVIRNKQPICHTKAEIQRLFKNLYDMTELADAQYMLAPLKIGNKIIGLVAVAHQTHADAFHDHDFTLFQAIASQASLAIRNAVLYDRTVRLADNLSIINQSIQDVMFNLDRSNALIASCQIAANVTRTSKAAIFLLDKDNIGMLKRIEAIGFDDLNFDDEIPYVQKNYEAGAWVVPQIDPSSDAWLQKYAKRGEFRAFVQIPLRSGTAIIGTLAVYHDEPYFYDTPELNLLSMLTNQITAALDNADLLQALELYAAEQAQLVHLSRVSSESLDLESIIIGICQMMAQILSVSYVAIGIHHPNKETLRLESNDGVSFGLSSYEVRLSEVPEIAAKIAPNSPSTLRVYHHATDTTFSKGLVNYMTHQDNQTLALLPMRLEQEIIGLIVLGDSGQRHFSDNDLRLLEMANNQITVQIQNALIHTRTEQQLATRLEQLELIEDISQQISEVMDLDLIIQNVLEAALQSTQADFASMAMLNTDKQHTFDIVWREVVDDRLIPNRIQFEESGGVIGHVSKTGEMLILPDNSAFDDYISPIDNRPAYRSSLAIPMKTSNSVIGVLNLESEQLDFFTSEQALFLNSLAGHAAISLDNANLLMERERQIHTLTLLRELSLDALSFIRREDIYAAVVRTALILLNGSESSLYWAEPVDQRIHLLASMRSDDGQMLDAKATIPIEILQETIQQSHIRLFPDISKEEAFNSAEVDYQSLIILPVARRQKICELLCIGFDHPREFSYQDLEIVDSLAVQIAGHLENAALNEAVTTNNDRMRAILDSTRDGIILLDNHGRIQDVNSAAKDLIGIDLSPYLFKPLDTIRHADGLSEQASETWISITETYCDDPLAVHNQEYELHQDDTIVYIKILVQGVIDKTDETVGHLLILRDITEEKKLQKFQIMMQSMVLHDLRGPLTSIVTSMYVAENLIELYEGDFDDLRTSLLKTFGVSLISAEDMLRQVDTLRDLPMLREMQVKPQRLPMYDIADAAFNSLSANYQESNIDVQLQIDPAVEVYADESLIRRVIINLMHNAFKFTPEEGTVLVQVNPHPVEDNYIRIDVADTGPGIPEAERERIFGQYIQIEGNKPRTGGKGTGLGLNFCKLAAEAHGGEIWVASDGPLSGACFSFTVPVEEWRAPEDIPPETDEDEDENMGLF